MDSVTIPSQTDPTVSYTVYRHDNGGLVCSCPSWQWRRYCCHCRKAATLFARLRAEASLSASAAVVMHDQTERLQSLSERLAGLTLDAEVGEKIFDKVGEIEAGLNSIAALIQKNKPKPAAVTPIILGAGLPDFVPPKAPRIPTP